MIKFIQREGMWQKNNSQYVLKRIKVNLKKKNQDIA